MAIRIISKNMKHPSEAYGELDCTQPIMTDRTFPDLIYIFEKINGTISILSMNQMSNCQKSYVSNYFS